MRDRLIEIFKKINYKPFEQCNIDANLATQFTEYALNHIVDELLANGVIVPPCKVGDIVYRVSFVHKNVIPLKVEGFVCNLSSWKVHCTHLIPSWVGNQKEHLYISFSSFGKTVFPTIEEAEAKLKEREKNG